MSFNKNPRTGKQAVKPSSWTGTRLGLIAAAFVLLAAIATAFYRNESAAPAPTMATAPGVPSPANPLALPASVMEHDFNTLDGQARKLADYKGKVIVVDVWATWCGPCRQEIPHLIQLANEYKEKGVEVVGLTTENPQTDEPLVRAFAQQFKINYPIGWANGAFAAGLTNRRNGIPQTLIFGRDGRVRNHFVGFHPVLSLPQMREALESAVKES